MQVQVQQVQEVQEVLRRRGSERARQVLVPVRQGPESARQAPVQVSAQAFEEFQRLVQGPWLPAFRFRLRPPLLQE